MEDMETETLNYVWIGDPNQSNIDINGPIKMSLELVKQNMNNNILFYCLTEWVKHYSNIFNKYNNITVMSVNDVYLDLSKRNDYFTVALEIFLNLAYGKTVREKVIASDLSRLIVLFKNGSYYLDTSIEPTGEPLNFPSFESFKCVRLTDFKDSYFSKLKNNSLVVDLDHNYKVDALTNKFLELYNLEEEFGRITNNYGVDSYFLYSKKEDIGLLRSIDIFTKTYPIIEHELKNDNGNIDDYQSSLILFSIINGVNTTKKINKNTDYWRSPLGDDSPCRKIPFFGLNKIFMGSYENNTEEEYMIF